MGISDFFSGHLKENLQSSDDPALPLAFLGSIVESSDDAIIGLTTDGLVISWNAAATRIFGHTHDNAVGKPLE